MVSANRKLTTILSADVEGYSRLMSADEEGTFATLKTFREAIMRHVAGHGGRVVNTWGDGLLAEFASVVAAVRAAIDAQGELAERNAGKPPEMRMLYRIGINLGDVIVDGDDIYGDGVNIAARLQSEAPPGGILISNTVYDQVRNKLTVGFEFLGNLDVKNIEEAVPTFSVRIGGGEPGQGTVPPHPVVHATPRPAQGSASAAYGRTASAAAAERPAILSTGVFGNRWLQLLAIVPAGLVVLNLLSWGGEMWSKWPLMAFGVLAGLLWAKQQTRFAWPTAVLGVIGAMIVAINLFTWEGRFWAIWPLLAFALAWAALRVLRTNATVKNR
jgi:class 3 adenylate cyclase